MLFACALASCLLSLVSPVSAATPMQEYVEAMQPGWNLGNTLDATPNETAWGNPPVTQEFIQQIKAQGFKSIRIPVTWDTGSRVGPAPDYTIDPAWMNRVQQIVDWSLDAGLYVMLNLHHDSGWVRTMPANHDAVLAKFNAIWLQIALRFRDHSDKLHFESINEPTFDGVDSATKSALLKELNVSFFNIVRATGGGNATRPLVLPSVETNNAQEFLDSLSETMAQLNDSNLIATVHEYGLWNFATNIGGVTKFDGAAKDWTTAGIDRVYDALVSKGIPVIVGEIGLLDFGRYNEAIERGEALQFFEYTLSYYQSKGMTYQWWDAGGFFNRYSYQWTLPELYAYMIHTPVGRSSTAETDLLFLRDGSPLQDAVVHLNLNGNTFLSLDDGATPLVLGSDYMINGSVLTIKASALASYASGAFGEKTVLTANFSDGIPWKFFVRHTAAPALGAVSGTKAGALVIPTSFNGDMLAMVEARYVANPNFPYPGEANWTAFKQYKWSYLPDYVNNTIIIKKEFFAATTNEPVELTFHFWSGKKVNYRLTFQPGGGVIADPQELTIYDNQFHDGWGNWSWTPTNENSEEVVYSPTKSIAVDANPWAGTMLGNWMLPLNRSDYRTLTVWANGGAVGGQRLTVSAVYNWAGTGSSFLLDPLPANTWTKLEIPLASLGVTDSSNITGLVFSNNSGDTLPRYYLDEVHLTTAYPSWIVFVNGAPAPVITSSTIADGVFDSPFTYSTTAINNPTSFSATDLPPGLAIDSNSGVISGTPTAAGSYLTTVTATNAAGNGSQIVAITINPAAATIELSNLTLVYDGTAKSPTVVTTPAGLPVTLTFNGSADLPVNAGSYAVIATLDNPNYAATPATGTLVIQPAAATIELSNLTFVYDGTAKSPTVVTTPAGLPVTLTFNGSANVPVNAGSYAVVATLDNPNYVAAPATGTLVIQPFAATFTLPPGDSPFNTAINAEYDGDPQGVHVTTSPAGIPVTVTYNGSTTPPTLPGTYHVVVTSNDPNYSGSTGGTFVITVTALVRHAPAMSGDIDGSLQLLSGESFTLNGSSIVSGDLLVPGTPTVLVNGQAVVGGIVVDASGAVAPSNYSVALSKNAAARYVVRRVDPIDMPVVTTPALPNGTRSVTLTKAGQSVGDAATLRNLTLDASVGSVAVPAGVYGNFAVNGSNTLVLGVEGATVPAVYELQALTISKNASVKIVGPVTLKLASGLTLDGPLGSAAHPDWLELQIASGGVTVNGAAVVNGVVTAPNGTVIIDGSVHGRVNADRLTINGNGVLVDSGL